MAVAGNVVARIEVQKVYALASMSFRSSARRQLSSLHPLLSLLRRTGGWLRAAAETVLARARPARADLSIVSEGISITRRVWSTPGCRKVVADNNTRDATSERY